MKSTAFTAAVSLSLIIGSTAISKAEDGEVLRIPQAGGQYIEVRTGRPAKPTTAFFVRGRAKAKIDPVVAAKKKAEEKAKLHVFVGTNANGGPVILYAR